MAGLVGDFPVNLQDILLQLLIAIAVMGFLPLQDAYRASRGTKMFTFQTAESAATWFDTFNALLIVGAFAAAIGGVAVFIGTLGAIKAGTAKEKFSDERIAANEAETKRAIADADIAKEGTARANERAVGLEKDAANARLETERLKGVVAWRTIPPGIEATLKRELAAAPGAVNLRYTDGDPEALFLAIQIGNILSQSNWQVAPGAVKPAGSLLFGIAIPNIPESARLRDAFTAAGILFSDVQIPESGVSFNISTIPGAPTLMIGSGPLRHFNKRSNTGLKAKGPPLRAARVAAVTNLRKPETPA